MSHSLPIYEQLAHLEPMCQDKFLRGQHAKLRAHRVRLKSKLHAPWLLTLMTSRKFNPEDRRNPVPDRLQRTFFDPAIIGTCQLNG